MGQDLAQDRTQDFFTGLTTGEVAIDDGRVGAKPILSRAAEAGLIKAIIFMNLRGVGMTKEEVFEAAKALAEEEGCTLKGEDGLPTKHWWDGFRKRAAESGTPISLLIPHNLSRSRATSGSDSRLRAFFQLIHERVAEHGLDPSRDFINLDETQIVLDPTQKRVAVVCGTKGVHKLTGIYGERGVHITMVAAIVSDGTALPPTFIFQGKSVSHEMARATHNFDPNCGLAYSASGWIERSIYHEILKHLIDILPAPETRGYKLLIVDGHESHISLYAAQLAIANKLDIVLMPSHTSHLVQPLDVGVFGPLKMLSSAAMTKHSVLHLILPHDVPMIINDAYHRSFTRENIMSAFQKTGLSPLHGVDALPEDTVGPHDAIMASCGVSGAALSDQVTIVSFIEDGVAQEVKRRVDIEAVAMTTEDLQLRLKLSIQYHSMYVAACAVRPEQVQHAEPTSPQSSGSTTDDSEGESLNPQDNTTPTFKRLKGSAQCMTSAQWIDEFKAAEDMKRREIAEKEERRRKRKAALEEKAALERTKKPCEAIMKTGACKRAQCCTPSLPNASGNFYCARHQR